MKHPGLICYDFDGTLCNTLPDITESMNAVLRENGFEAVPEAAIRSFIGSGIGKLVERAIGFALERQRSHKTDVTAIGREMAEYYDAHLIVHSHLYPGVRETLRECSGMTQIIVSNKPEAMVRKMLAHFRIGRHFSLVAGGDTLEVSKPDPAVWEYVRTALQLPRDVRGLMVGDSIPDMAFGKVAGLKRIAVSYGYNDVPSLREAGADTVIDSLEELKEIAETPLNSK